MTISDATISNAAVELVKETLLAIGPGYRVAHYEERSSLHIGDFNRYFVNINFDVDHVRVRYLDYSSWAYVEIELVRPDFADKILSIVLHSLKTSTALFVDTR